MECVCQIIISPFNATEHNSFNLMNSGLVSHFGAMLQFGLCKEVIYAGGVLLFAPVGEDNRHNKVSISFVIFLQSLTELWYLSDGIHSRGRAGMQADGNIGWMMKSLVSFSRYEVNGRNEKPIIGVEWKMTVLSGSQATALSSQQFTVIRGGCEGLLEAPVSRCKMTCEYSELKEKKKKLEQGLIITLSHILYI